MPRKRAVDVFVEPDNLSVYANESIDAFERVHE